MNYIQISIETTDAEQREILIALLSDLGFEGFEEQADKLTASIPEHLYQQEAVTELTGKIGLLFTKETILPQNWNAVWEAGFEPVTVAGFCTVRASFHKAVQATPHEIIITPKMSFGTGHHATTQLMIEAMRHINFAGKGVLDFGTGTGILAILAKKLGAGKVTAIDNDAWSIENAGENAAMNGTELILQEASLEDIGPGQYNIVLANINRNILLQYMNELGKQIISGGMLLLSGILEADEKGILQSAEEAGFVNSTVSISNGWIAIALKKG